MYKKKVLKNTIISVICFITLSIFRFILRKVFLLNFDVELLGYEGLFTSIFTFLSIAEMGSGGMFAYMLYKAVAEKDYNEQSVIMSLYKKVYAFIGAIVLFFGIVVFLFLPYVIKEHYYNWGYVRFIYFIQLITILITYYLAYKRSLVYAHQDAYVVTFLSSIYEIIGCIIRCALIIIFKNYILYIIIPFFVNLVTNIHISKYCDTTYFQVKSVKTTILDFKNRDIFNQMFSLLISKISTVLYSTSDSIIISIISGIRTMGLYSNYLQFVAVGKILLSYFSEPLGHSIGNFVYNSDENKKKETYYAIDMLGYFIGLLSLAICVCIFEKVICFMYGSQYLLGISVVYMVGLDFYIRCRGLAYCAFRGTVGHYDESRIFDLIGAISNIVLSVYLGKIYGIVGILFATVIGNIFIQSGRAVITFKYVIRLNVFREIIKEILFILLSILFVFITYKITYRFNSDLIGILISILIPSILFLFIFFILHKSGRIKLLIKYNSEIIVCLKQKFIH